MYFYIYILFELNFICLYIIDFFLNIELSNPYKVAFKF